MDPRFEHDTYMIRRKVFKIFGGEFRVFDPAGTLILFSKQKAFKLREDIRVYADETLRSELLYIQARKIIDFRSAYDVVDSPTGEKIGGLKRKGLKSIVQDHWILMDAHDGEIGFVEEEGIVLSLLRRFINLIPQRFNVVAGDRIVGTFRQNFNPFVLKITADFSNDQGRMLDRRLGLAAGVLLSAIEGRQG